MKNSDSVFPPRAFGKQIGETIYSVNWLPFGGFVRLHGEQEEEGITNQSRAFLYRNKRTRISVVIAGVIMNFLLAIVAFAVVYSFAGIPRDTHQIKVVDITTDSPAQTAGVIVGDIVTKVGKDSVTNIDDFISKVDAQKGKTITIEIQRNGSTVKLNMVPRENPPEQ